MSYSIFLFIFLVVLVHWVISQVCFSFASCAFGLTIMIINKLKWNDLSVLSCKGGYEAYTRWKYDWTIHSGQKEASIKVYVSEMIMPFWVQCTLCFKWREFPEKELTPAVIKSWKCSTPSCIITSNNKVKSKYSITNSLSDLDT